MRTIWKIRGICTAYLALFSWTFPTSGQSSGSRGVALVVGNTQYAGQPLNNAVSDAADVAAALTDLGLSVTLKENLDRTGLKQEIEKFRSAASSDPGTAVFYYSGHGLQVNGMNYLIPIGISASKPSDIPGQAISLQDIFDALGPRTSPNVIILDACRANPFATPSAGGWVSGLAAPLNPPSNSVIAFSTAPGNLASDGVGTHSPYTRALLRYIHTPGQSLTDLFARVTADVSSNTDAVQVPWENISLSTTLYFRKPIIVTITLSSADDDAMVMVNGETVADWNQDQSAAKSVVLSSLTNSIVVKVYNQKSYTGGIPYVTWRPEGWHYGVNIADGEGKLLAHFEGSEDVPLDNGPHHGKLFTVATATLQIDEKTGHLSISAKDPNTWQH